MEKTDVLAALTILAQESHLDVLRLLVQAGADGIPADHIGERSGLPFRIYDRKQRQRR